MAATLRLVNGQGFDAAAEVAAKRKAYRIVAVALAEAVVVPGLAADDRARLVRCHRLTARLAGGTHLTPAGAA